MCSVTVLKPCSRYVGSPMESLHVVTLCTYVQLHSKDSVQHDCETTADLQSGNTLTLMPCEHVVINIKQLKTKPKPAALCAL